MWTEDDEKELKRLKTRKRRALDTGTRKAMLEWSKSEKGKAARKKYRENGGAEKEREYNEINMRAGCPGYIKKLDYRHATFQGADKRGAQWTIEDEIKLIDLFESGMTASQIAPLLKRSLQGIERKLDKLGIRRNKVA